MEKYKKKVQKKNKNSKSAAKKALPPNNRKVKKVNLHNLFVTQSKETDKIAKKRKLIVESDSGDLSEVTESNVEIKESGLEEIEPETRTKPRSSLLPKVKRENGKVKVLNLFSSTSNEDKYVVTKKEQVYNSRDEEEEKREEIKRKEREARMKRLKRKKKQSLLTDFFERS